MRYFAKEPGWERVSAYMIRPTSVEMSLKEVANAMRSKIASKEMSEKDAGFLLGQMRSNTRFVEQGEIIEEALHIAVRKAISLYDALFIAAALKSAMGLATSDARQAAAARELGVAVELL